MWGRSPESPGALAFPVRQVVVTRGMQLSLMGVGEGLDDTEFCSETKELIFGKLFTAIM